LKINTGGYRPVPSAPDDLFEKFLALGDVSPESDTIPLDLAHFFPGRGEAVAADGEGFFLRGAIGAGNAPARDGTLRDVAPFFRGMRPEGSGVVLG
jgi:hypothetical protein